MSGNTIWLASYPKSGNTWFRTVFAAWRRADPFALDALGPVTSNRDQFDRVLGLGSSDLTAAEVLRLRPAVDEVLDAEIDEPHLAKIHDSLFSGLGGTPVVSLNATRCAIYLVRDPRDVAVSFAHHLDRTPSTVAKRICSPDLALADGDRDITTQITHHLGRWADHVTGWVDEAPFPVHVLRYEDCLTDPMASFGSALKFAGFAIGTDELADALELASFAKLQQRERSAGFGERRGRHSPFFRRGIAGGWRDELGADLAALLESEYRDVMERFGYLPSRTSTRPAQGRE